MLDSTQPNSTGPVYYTTFIPGEYLIHFQANINTTACNILPATTPKVDIMVHVRTTFHQGERTSGSLSGATKLPGSGTGYYHYWGTDPPTDKDNWGGAETMIRLIPTVGAQWYQSHQTPKIGIGDISRQNGGEFRNLTTNVLEHSEHQNGLDIDVRYVGHSPINNGETPVDLTNTNDLFNV